MGDDTDVPKRVNPYLSVVVPTFRMGGLDVLVDGLRGQEFRDFELVLVDCVMAYRPDVFKGFTDFPVRHVDPIRNPFPVASFCRCANTGLGHARGEVVVMVTDYTWLPPGCLARHAAFHRARPTVGHDVLLCPHEYASHPPPGALFPGYGREDIDDYVQDLRDGVLEGFGWSLSDSQFSGGARALPPDLPHGVHGSDHVPRDPKLDMSPGFVEPHFFHGKNASARKDLLIFTGGWNEAFDGGHGYQDTEFAWRLAYRAGAFFHLELEDPAVIVNPRHHFPWLRQERDVHGNEEIWRALEAQDYPEPGPFFPRQEWDG